MVAFQRVCHISGVLVVAFSGAIAALFLTVPVARAQSENAQIFISTHPYFPGPVLHAQRNLVDIRVVVRDRRGKPVGGLKGSDFLVYDNGKLQDISDFSVDYAGGKAVNGSSRAPATPVINRAASVRPVAPRPRFIALFFDDRDKPLDDLVYSRRAAEKFVETSLAPGDRVGIFTASGKSELNFTQNSRALAAALKNLQPHLKMPGQALGSCPREGLYEAYQITMNDPEALNQAMLKAQACCQACRVRDPRLRKEMLKDAARNQANELVPLAQQFSMTVMGSLRGTIQSLARMHGRRILVLASPGFLTATLRPEMQDLVDAAVRDDVVINSLDSSGLEVNMPGGDISRETTLIDPAYAAANTNDAVRWANDESDEMDDVLEVLADGTGGRFFHNDNNLGNGLRELAAAPQVSYTLGFSPSHLKADGQLHKLKVKLAQSGKYTLKYRHAYFAPTKVSLEDQATLKKINHEVLATDSVQGLPVVVTAKPAKLDTGKIGVGVFVRIDLRRLSFRRRQGRHTQKLTLVSALLDGKGRFVVGYIGTVDMALKNRTWRDATKGGMTVRLALPAEPGTYQLREVVAESASNKMFASSQKVVVR